MLTELQAIVGFLEDGGPGGRAGYFAALDKAVSAFEKALAYRADPPGESALSLAGRLVNLLESLPGGRKQKLERRVLARFLSRLCQAMQLREEALEYARLHQRLTPEDSPLREAAGALTFLAKACYWSDDQQGAVEYQRRALDLLDRARERGELSEEDEKDCNAAYTVWAFRYAQNTCAWAEADRTFESALGRARGWGDTGLLSAALILYAESKMFQGEWEACERLGAECARTALAGPGEPVSDYPFWILGRALVHNGRAREALPELERAVRIARDTGDAVGLSEALISRAEAFLAVGEKRKALENASVALRVAEYARLGVNLDQVRIWRFWVETQADRTSAARHLEPLHRSLADFERLGLRSGWACALHALGHALALCNRRETARFYLERAVRAFEEWDMHWHRKRAVESLKLVS
ncbi:MAG: hypothetical protein JXQ83_13765 [Candidatus Glassbacteria bacterium]|nr:hypothetical protein [Candidatus Glassbacteria bacterium]